MRRKTWVLAGAVVLGAVTAVSVVVARSGAEDTSSAAQAPAVSTAPVKKGPLSAMVSLDGILTYGAGPDGSPYSVIDQAGGTYTQLPGRGQVISQGQVLYRVDDSPVVLLYGPTPAWRTLSVGTAGADVAQLNADLVALGYATPDQLGPGSAFFGTATAVAVERLQAAVGVAQDGVITLGLAVFEPGAVRVTTLYAEPGGRAGAGQTVFQATSTGRQVQLALDASQQSEMAVGDKVTITLPDNRTTAGAVSSVGTVATCPSSAAPGGSGSSSAGPGTDTCSSGSAGRSTTPTIAVVVTPSDPAATGTWDEAPVRVTITTARVPDALAVPVSALLARSGGGYAVEVVGTDGAHRLVPVSLGMFDDADGLVQVTGSGLAAGQEVVVPST